MVYSTTVTASTADKAHSTSYQITVDDGMPVHTDTTVATVSNMYLVTVAADRTVEGMQIIVAGYDENGQVVSVQFADRNSMQAILPKENIAYLKAFVWTEDMRPLSRAKLYEE